MNNWFSSLLAELSDGPRLVRALLGEARDVSVDLCRRYCAFLKKLVSFSIPVGFLGIIFFALSDLSGWAFLYFIGLLLITPLIAFWMFVLQPAVIISEQLSKIPLIDRLFKRVVSIICISLLVLLFAFNAPAGTDGIKATIGFILFLFGCVLLGVRFTRKVIGWKFIFGSVCFAIFLYFPFATNNISRVIAAIDRDIFDSFIPPANELEMSLANLSGKNPNAPRLFPKDGNTPPLWWCRKDDMSVAKYRCFDQSGRDPITNEELVPISPEIIRQSKNRLVEENRQVSLKKAMEKEQVALQQAEEAANAERMRIKILYEERHAYIQKYIATEKNRVRFAIAFLNDQNLDNSVAQKIQGRIPNLSSSTFLTQQAGDDGVFNRIFAGDKSEFEKLNLLGIADWVMVGKIVEHFEKDKMIPGATDATIEVDVRIFDVKTGHIIKEERFSSDVVMGYSKSDAQKEAQDRVITKIINDIVLPVTKSMRIG